VGSLTLVIPEETGTLEDHPNEISVVQQSPVIINRFRKGRSAQPSGSSEEWI
jgi:hypothetical protein